MERAWCCCFFELLCISFTRKLWDSGICFFLLRMQITGSCERQQNDSTSFPNKKVLFLPSGRGVILLSKKESRTIMMTLCSLHPFCQTHIVSCRLYEGESHSYSHIHIHNSLFVNELCIRQRQSPSVSFSPPLFRAFFFGDGDSLSLPWKISSFFHSFCHFNFIFGPKIENMTQHRVKRRDDPNICRMWYEGLVYQPSQNSWETWWWLQ